MKLQVRFFIAITAILAAVICLSRLSPDSETVLAGESARLLVSDESARTLYARKGHASLVSVSDNEVHDTQGIEVNLLPTVETERTENESSEDLSYLYTPEYLSGCEETTLSEDWIIPAAQDKNRTDILLEGIIEEDIWIDEIAATEDFEEPLSTVISGDTILPETENAAIMVEIGMEEYDAIIAAIAEAERNFAEYRKTDEYFNSLLVTHPDYYNAEIVKHAEELAKLTDEERYLLLTGAPKKVYYTYNMPKGFTSERETAKKMVTFDVPAWKMNSAGERYPALFEFTIHSELEDSIRCIFSDIYQLDIKFPLYQLIGFMYRKVGGSGMVNLKFMSMHAFGVALDINRGDYDNDMYLGKGNDLRNKNNPYCIPDEVIAIFEKYGWHWGGNYEICTDTMHFQYFGLEFLKYDTAEPFPVLEYGLENPDEVALKNLQQRLVKLGYLTKVYKTFNKKVAEAVIQFQTDNGLEPDGIVDYETWVPLVNYTHEMKYVF